MPHRTGGQNMGSNYSTWNAYALISVEKLYTLRILFIQSYLNSLIKNKITGYGILFALYFSPTTLQVIVMKYLKNVAFGILAAGAVASSHAAVVNFQYEALNSSQFQAISGDFGASMSAGDTANLTLQTTAGNQFQATSSDQMWAILGFLESGTRVSDYSYGFYNNGSLVSSGGSLGEGTAAIHMGPYLSAIGFNGAFDEFRWSGVLTSSDATANTTDDIMFGSDGYGFTSARFEADISAVPEPSSVALIGLALLGLTASRRRRQEP